MNLFQSLLYGLISGFAEFLPVSSRGHQAFIKKLFGVSTAEPIRDMMIHIALLTAVIISCGTYIVRIQRERKNIGKRRGVRSDKRALYDYRLIRAAALPMLLVMLFNGVFDGVGESLALLALCFSINGMIVYVTNHLAHGNKDSSKMSTLDALLLGLSASLAIIPGISRVGVAMSCAIARGADKSKAFDWILLISIPAIAFWLIADIIGAFSTGFGSVNFMAFLGYFISALASFGSALAGIYLMRFLTVRVGISAFGFYCWGAALLAFILYLTA